MFNKLFSSLTKTKFDNARLICGLIWLLYFSLVSFISVAAPVEPKSNDIVASWESSAYLNSASLQSVRDHLQKAQFAGQANIHHSIARSLLVQLSGNQQKNSEYWYLLARSLQHQHDFKQALSALDNALNLNSNFSSAWLLRANIHLTQSDFAAAKNSCTKLIGNLDLITVATCSLEVTSYEGKLEQSYEQLTAIMKRSKLADYSSNEQNWRTEVLADMALRLGKVKEAEQWMNKALNNGQLGDMPLSFITLWADIQQELGVPQRIWLELNAILDKASFKDDALLVRLAMAEKASNKTTVTEASNYWQEQVERRIHLRLQRQDLYHAADIARYFIYVQPSPQQALKWATINFQQAQLYDDQQLLQKAKKLNGIEVVQEQSYVSG